MPEQTDEHTPHEPQGAWSEQQQAPNDSQNSTESGMRSVVLGLVVLIVAAAAAGWVYVYGVPGAGQAGTAGEVQEIAADFNTMQEASRERNVEQALAQADALWEEVQQKDVPAIVKADVQMTRAINLFRTGREDAQREATQIVRDIARNPVLTRQERAIAINQLLIFYYSGRFPHVYEEIFADEAFADLQTDSEKTAIRNLAERSMELFPNSFAVQRIAVWYSAELLDNASLQATQREEYRSEIRTLLSQAYALFTQEQNGVLERTNSNAHALFYHWRGFNRAALALNDQAPTADFEQAFQKALNTYEPDSAGAKSVASVIVYTHFYYAAFLHEIFGDARVAEQRQHLEELVTMVREDPETYVAGFLRFAETERTRAPETRDHNYRWFTELAQVSPEFSQLLQDMNWDLVAS